MYKLVWFTHKGKEKTGTASSTEELYEWLARRSHKDQICWAVREEEDILSDKQLCGTEGDDSGVYEVVYPPLNMEEYRKVYNRLYYPTVNFPTP